MMTVANDNSSGIHLNLVTAQHGQGRTKGRNVQLYLFVLRCSQIKDTNWPNLPSCCNLFPRMYTPSVHDLLNFDDQCWVSVHAVTFVNICLQMLLQLQ